MELVKSSLLIANVWEKDISILAGNLNSGHSYPTTTVMLAYQNQGQKVPSKHATCAFAL